MHIEAAISRDATDALVVGKVPGSECDDSKSGCSCVSWTTGLPLAVGYCRQQRIHGSGLATGDRRELLSYSMTTFPHTTLCICTSALRAPPPNLHDTHALSRTSRPSQQHLRRSSDTTYSPRDLPSLETGWNPEQADCSPDDVDLVLGQGLGADAAPAVLHTAGVPRSMICISDLQIRCASAMMRRVAFCCMFLRGFFPGSKSYLCKARLSARVQIGSGRRQRSVTSERLRTASPGRWGGTVPDDPFASHVVGRSLVQCASYPASGNTVPSPGQGTHSWTIIDARHIAQQDAANNFRVPANLANHSAPFPSLIHLRDRDKAEIDLRQAFAPGTNGTNGTRPDLCS